MAKYQYVNNDNDVISTDDQHQAGQYDAMGYRTAAPEDIRLDNIKQQYSGAWNTVGASALGALDAVPFALPAVEAGVGALTGSGTQAVTDTATNMMLAHPVATTVGNIAGGTAAFVSGEGLAAEAGLEGASFLMNASRGAVVNTVLGRGKAVENAIFQHAVSPSGQEHTWADIGMDTLMDAAVGGATAVPGAIVGKAASFIGKAGDSLAKVGDQEAMLDMNKVNDGLAATRKVDVMQDFEAKGYAGKSYSYVKADLDKRLPDLEAQFNEIKANAKVPLPASQMGIMVDSIGNCFEGSSPEVQQAGRDLVNDIVEKPQYTVQDLHNLRQQIDNKISYDADPSDLDKAHHAARMQVSTALQNTLEANDTITNGVRAAQWKQVDSDYSNLKVMQAALKKPGSSFKGLDGLIALHDDWKPFIQMAGAIGGLKGLVSVAGINRAVKFAKVLQGGEYTSVAKGLGKIFNKQADTWSKAVEAGLYGAPEAAASLVNGTLTHEDYDVKSNRAQWILQNPTEASSNMSEHLQKMGADPQTQTQMIGKAVSAATYLSQQRAPNPQAGSIMPTHTYMPEEIQREWNGQYMTIHDPTHALVDPTPKNIATMRQFHPDIYKKTTNAIIQELQNNPNLPIESRLWASKVLGVPVDALTSPQTYQLIQMGRQQVQQKQQQAEAQAQQAQKKSGNSGNAGVDSNSTSLQHLQGKQ